MCNAYYIVVVQLWENLWLDKLIERNDGGSGFPNVDQGNNSISLKATNRMNDVETAILLSKMEILDDQLIPTDISVPIF